MITFAGPPPAEQEVWWRRFVQNMGIKNYLIEGVSCAGKTTVCDELLRRGYHTIDGDRELAYFGDLETGEPLADCASENRSWIWDVEKVRALVADQSHPATFFCGGSRNSDIFIDLFDEVFVLEIDLDTLNRRLAARPEDEWGGTASEGESFARLQHATKESLPQNATVIDATAPLASVVDAILENANEMSP
jgi:gluconate kinase